MGGVTASRVEYTVDLSKAATCEPVFTDLYREVVALQR